MQIEQRGTGWAGAILVSISLCIVLILAIWFSGLLKMGPPEEDIIDLQKTYSANYIPEYLANNYMGKEVKLKTVTITSSNVESGAKYEISIGWPIDWKDKIYLYDDGLIEDALRKYATMWWDLTGVMTTREIGMNVSPYWGGVDIQVEDCTALYVTNIDSVSFEEYMERLLT